MTGSEGAAALQSGGWFGAGRENRPLAAVRAHIVAQRSQRREEREPGTGGVLGIGELGSRVARVYAR